MSKTHLTIIGLCFLSGLLVAWWHSARAWMRGRAECERMNAERKSGDSSYAVAAPWWASRWWLRVRPIQSDSNWYGYPAGEIYCPIWAKPLDWGYARLFGTAELVRTDDDGGSSNGGAGDGGDNTTGDPSSLDWESYREAMTPQEAGESFGWAFPINPKGEFPKISDESMADYVERERAARLVSRN